MLNICYKNSSYKSDDERVRSMHLDLIAEMQKNQIKQGFKHSYKINDDDATELQSYFKSEYVYQNPNVHLLESSHPILAILNEYCNLHASRAIQGWKERGLTTLSIGDNIDRKLGAHHNCLLINNSREYLRVADSKQPLVQDFATGRIDNLPLCHLGVQNCYFTADRAVAVHSLYDITPSQIYRAFVRHNLDSLIAYLYVPLSLYDPQYADFDHKSFKIFIKNRDAYFSMRDDSIPYKHDYDNWRNLVTISKIKSTHSGSFDIVVEHVRRHGPLHIIKFQRARRSEDIFPLYIPISEYLGGMCLVPNIYHAIVNDFAYDQTETPHIFAPIDVVSALMAYALRTKDESYKYSELATLASGLKSKVVIASSVYRKEWVIKPADYKHCVLSIFILGAIDRAERTGGISKAFKELQFLTTCGFLGELQHNIRRWFTRHFTSEKNVTNVGPGDKLSTWNIQFVQDVIYEKCFVVYEHDEPCGTNNKSDRQVKFCDEESDEKEQSTHEISDECSETESVETTISIISDDTVEQCPNNDNTSRRLIDADVAANNLNINTNTEDFETESVRSCSVKTTKSENIAKNFAVNIPRNFLGGHCAMRAFWLSFPEHARPRQNNFLAQCYTLLIRSRCEIDDVDNYIKCGVWDNDCSSVILQLLAEKYNRNVRIYDDKRNMIVQYNPKAVSVANMMYLSNHYTNMDCLRGGKIEKFKPMVNRIAQIVREEDKLVELSAAPGYLINYLFEAISDSNKYIHFFAGQYIGPSASAFTQNPEDIRIQKFGGDFMELFPQESFDFIINDAGREVNIEALTDAACDYINRKLLKGGSCLIKTFADPHRVYMLATHFKNVELFAGCSDDERYFLLIDRQTDCSELLKVTNLDRFYEIYDQYHVQSYKFAMKADIVKVRAFVDGYFKAIEGVKPNIQHNRDITFTANVYSGFASASKTTGLIKYFEERNINFKFISPTKELCEKHRKIGCTSTTPHLAFKPGYISDNGVIVIDEFTQFCVEYVALIKLLHPTTTIWLCGDVYQTGFCNLFDKNCYTPLSATGITNSNIDVYKIPHDICDILNTKYNWFIRTHSPVQKSIYKLANTFPLKSIINKKFICVNALTAEKLRANGYNCSTITTYTGSRDTDVVLYIDSAAVESNYVNDISVVYTALTRATDRLFVYGDTESIERFFNFSATCIFTYEEFAELFHHSESFIKADIDEIKYTQNREIVFEEISPTIATSIIDNIVKPVNDDNKDVLVHVIPEIKSVDGGVMKLTANLLENKPYDQDCKVVDPHFNAVINQVSSNPIATIQTMVGRYGKKFKNSRKIDRDFCYSQLVNGLLKAIYGSTYKRRTFARDMRTTKEELLKYSYEYLESLNEKLGDNAKNNPEIDTLFDTDEDGKLSFFNKKQTKWKAIDGFDTTDKVGQGVAAFHKKVNILYSAYARCMLDKIRSILARNGRKIILATHHSEAEINDEYVKMLDGLKVENWTCNDFSEWDSSFRKPFAKITSFIMSLMGMPPHMIAWFENNRENWEMIYINSLGRASLKGCEKQFSGNPFTIAENTIGNMALCFSIFEYHNFQFGLFKGDDSAVACSSCRMMPCAKRILEYTTHGLKLHNSPIGEFAGWFLTDYGLFPDVVRYAAKFLSKTYNDQEHFDEALKSLQERCSAVKNHKQLYHGCYMTSLYYTQTTGRPISDTECYNLFHFLKCSRNIKFGDLPTITKRVNQLNAR